MRSTFDGPLHSYTKGWQDGTIYDDPTPGGFDAIRCLQKSYAVVVFTARDVAQVAGWLTERGVACLTDARGERSFWDDQDVVLVTNRKPLAVAYVDDRAIRWVSWGQALTDFEAHEAAYRTKPEARPPKQPGLPGGYAGSAVTGP